ncbi:MAG: hypothetical protein FWD89_01075 [Firmicutes bacterium]|nr:hypothetical protein [Bacillota bacterium]MCL2770885.1 hypothetical protein [Bacillota bacterium]
MGLKRMNEDVGRVVKQSKRTTVAFSDKVAMVTATQNPLRVGAPAAENTARMKGNDGLSA